MQISPSELLEPVCQIARQAGRRILEIYATDFQVDTKQDQSPLTAADMASHHSIIAGLEALTPNLPVLSEESAEIAYEERSRWQHYWLIDPLDGTKEFVRRNGEFTVNIALIAHQRAILGVVHVPVRNIDYYGYVKDGAYRREGDNVTRIQACAKASSPVRVVGSRSHRGASLDSFLDRLGVHELVAMGSSLKICLVADGQADIYPRLGPTCEWDTAAAQAVVESAGGHVTDTDGIPLRYNTKAEYLNPHFLVFGDNSRNWCECL